MQLYVALVRERSLLSYIGLGTNQLEGVTSLMDESL